MKHLLILISFLLLSSLLTSCEKKEGTFYLWETSSGKVCKPFGEEGKQRGLPEKVRLCLPVLVSISLFLTTVTMHTQAKPPCLF